MASKTGALVFVFNWGPNGLIAIGAKSATVVGAEGWLCDALATPVMPAGQSELAGYQVFAVNRHEQSAWSI